MKTTCGAYILGIGAAVALLLAGCASTQQQTPETPLYKYRAQMDIYLNGTDQDPYSGMAVTALAPSIAIPIKSYAELDRVQVTTCGRQHICEHNGYCDPGFKLDNGWFGDASNTMTYTYSPTATESATVCPVYIEAYAKDLLTDWAYVALRTNETLPATMDCNGTRWKFAGISVCQTKAGLVQYIGFDHDVKFSASSLCTVTAINGREFNVTGQQGFCYVSFSDGKTLHHLILLGYDQVLVRVQ